MNRVPNLNVLDIIQREITRDRHPLARRHKTFYPSSASVELESGEVLGGCWRADWYRIHQVPPSDSNSFYMHMIWSFGKHIESVLVDALKCSGMYENEGVKFFDEELNLSGELDIVGRYRLGNDVRYYGVEVKSVYSIGATKTITGRSRAWKGQSAFFPFPKETNLMQVMIYLDQFSAVRGSPYELDFFKLMYIPRDKPNVGREYTITLCRKEDLPEDLLRDFGADLKDNHRYALVATDPLDDGTVIPLRIESRFSIEDIYERFIQEKEFFLEGVVPPRPFKKFYSLDEIESLYKADAISKTAYTSWQKAKKPLADISKTPGHYLCQSYCEYRSFCYNRDGSENKLADSVGLVLIDDPQESR